MQTANPYAFDDTTPAALAAADARAAFLRKTYSLLLAGVLAFAATLWAAGNVEPVRSWAEGLGRAIYGSRWGFLLYIGLFLVGGMAVHAVAEKKPINLIAYFGYTFLLGLLLAPLVLTIAAVNGPSIINQAALLTSLVFAALTVVVFVTGKDFSFLGSFLWMGMAALLGVALCGWLFGFGIGLWFSAAVAVLFAGYILYDTSNVLHRYPTTMAVSAAVVLFTDVVLLFKHILILLANRD